VGNLNLVVLDDGFHVELVLQEFTKGGERSWLEGCDKTDAFYTGLAYDNIDFIGCYVRRLAPLVPFSVSVINGCTSFAHIHPINVSIFSLNNLDIEDENPMRQLPVPQDTKLMRPKHREQE